MIGQGTTEYTVESIMQRLYVTYLEPPDNQPALARSGGDLLIGGDQLVIAAFAVPEDRGLLGIGTLVEMKQELMRVVDIDLVTNTLTVERGVYGTQEVDHLTGDSIVLSPPFPRAAVFEAVADNIILLYPKLFTTGAELVSPTAAAVYSIGDPLAVTVLSVTPGDFTRIENLHGDIVDFHPMTGGRSLILNHPCGSVWLRYRRRMNKPTSEADTLAELGVDERWVNIIMAGAGADLLAGRDIAESHTEWVKNVLEAENIRVGTRLSISGGLRQYRNNLLDDAQSEMKGEYKTKVRMRQASMEIV